VCGKVYITAQCQFVCPSFSICLINLLEHHVVGLLLWALHAGYANPLDSQKLQKQGGYQL